MYSTSQSCCDRRHFPALREGCQTQARLNVWFEVLVMGLPVHLRQPRSRAPRRPVDKAVASYDAFISYSHAVDRQFAPALQRSLHRLAKPWHRLRALRVFRDEASLSADPHLWSSIQDALQSSRFFILLASPESARSA